MIRLAGLTQVSASPAQATRPDQARKQLSVLAFVEFRNRQQSNAVTERLNEVYSRRPAKVDSALHRARRARHATGDGFAYDGTE